LPDLVLYNNADGDFAIKLGIWTYDGTKVSISPEKDYRGWKHWVYYTCCPDT
nr:nicotinic acetylcholine receptor alpha chain - marbled electric ray (fragments) [Torpedo marmorata]